MLVPVCFSVRTWLPQTDQILLGGSFSMQLFADSVYTTIRASFLFFSSSASYGRDVWRVWELMSEVSFDAVKESLRLNCPEEELGPNKGSCSCSVLLFFNDALSWTCMNIKDVHLQQQLEGRA